MLVVFDVSNEQIIIYLVPEYYRFIGLSDEIMDDCKAFYKSILRVPRGQVQQIELGFVMTDAPTKIKESTQFITILQESQHMM